MTRDEIETAIYQRLDKHTSSIDPTTQSRIRNFVAQRLRRLLSRPGISATRTETHTATCTAGSNRFGLPYAVARIQRIWDPSTMLALQVTTLDWLRQNDPALSSRGIPIAYVPLGYQSVTKQPANASTLFLVSSSASDATQTAYLEGWDSAGLPLTKSVVLTGTTATLFTGTFAVVTKFYLSAAPAGIVTLTEDSAGGTTLAQIGVGRTEGSVYIVLLWPVPSSAMTYGMDIDRRLTDLAHATDVPPIPEDFHDILVLGACMDEFLRMKDERYGLMAREYSEREKDLKVWLNWGQGQRPVAGSMEGQRPSWSPAGGWYPTMPWGRW